MCLLTPKASLDKQTTFITYRYHSLIFDLAIFQLATAYLSYCTNYSNNINSSCLIKSFNLWQRNKRKSSVLNTFIIWDFSYFTLFIKNKAEIILNGCKSLISYLDSSIRQKVNMTFFQYGLKLINSILKERCLYLCSMFIHQLNIEQVSLWPLVLPASSFSFLCHAGFDSPVVVEGGECFYWSIGFFCELLTDFAAAVTCGFIVGVGVHFDVFVVIAANQLPTTRIQPMLSQHWFRNRNIRCTFFWESFFIIGFIVFWWSDSLLDFTIDNFRWSA